MIAACAAHVPLRRLPAQVVVIRDGKRLTKPEGKRHRLFLRVGDDIRVERSVRFTFAYAGNRFSATHAEMELTCRRLPIGSPTSSTRTGVLAVTLRYGRVRVRAGQHPRRALVLSREMLVFAAGRDTNFVVERNGAVRSTRSKPLDDPIIVSRTYDDMPVRIDARVPYTAISDDRGLRLDVWPFSISRHQRPATTHDRLTPFWGDGTPCSVGCTAPGTPGWPLQPFHRQHAIRAAINELRPANFHVAVDIQARGSQPVYAIESGYAQIRYPGTPDVNVDVGRFQYWHIRPTVSEGEYVVAYRTVIGRVLEGFKHLALSEGSPSDYLNPLRPGGSLRPYHDAEPPIIGTPRIYADGRVIVGSFDPQSFTETATYETPVLAPSSLAWRLYDARGHALTGLEWGMRGSQNYPPGLKSLIFAPGASNPGFGCFAERLRCIPNWVYRLAGGLTEPLPLAGLRPGRYRLTVYAWDWVGNTSAYDDWITLPLAAAATGGRAEFGPLAPRFDYQ